MMRAQCRTATGLRGNASITDLTPEGCCVMPVDLSLSEGQRVWIKPHEFESLAATVRWVRGRFAGLEFEKPLYGPVADHLQAAFRALRR